MKLFKLSFLTAIAAMLVMGLTGSAFAFHDGGVADCEGCHSMHDSYKGLANDVATSPGGLAPLTGNDNLLKGSDPSSTCLNCHGTGNKLASYHVATDAAGFPSGSGDTLPVQRTPGGDFAWLKVAFSNASSVNGFGWYVPQTGAAESANEHGHHINAQDFQYYASTNVTAAPGGTYLPGDLSCTSCHNPHTNATSQGTGPISGSGSYGGTPDPGTSFGVYRLLGTAGYLDAGAPSEPAFTAAAPIAVAPNTYNQGYATNQVKVAYGSGMSEWCANCHSGILNNSLDASITFRHVAGSNAILNQTIAPETTTILANYNGYVNSGNLTGGTQTTSYLALVPYEEASSDYTILTPLAGNGSPTYPGPTGGNVMCLSCHRAHASAFDSMTRFDATATFITDNVAGGEYAFKNKSYEEQKDNSGYYSAGYYDYPASNFGPAQRDLCNKCHAKG
jgi:predicted CXXCH cytochrome family protein